MKEALFVGSGESGARFLFHTSSPTLIDPEEDARIANGTQRRIAPFRVRPMIDPLCTRCGWKWILTLKLRDALWRPERNQICASAMCMCFHFLEHA